MNAVERWQPVGQQPYEMTWVQRSENTQTLVDFEDLEGWKLELYNGAEGEFRRTREQQMWGQYVGKFLYSGTRPGARVIARPPKPVPIPYTFDSVELWGYGNRWGRRRDDPAPVTDVSVLIVDSRGKEFRVQMTDIKWRQWWLIHRKIPGEILSQLVLPASFSGIEVAMSEAKDPRYFFCDSLAFFTEELKPLALKP